MQTSKRREKKAEVVVVVKTQVPLKGANRVLPSIWYRRSERCMVAVQVHYVCYLFAEVNEKVSPSLERHVETRQAVGLFPVTTTAIVAVLTVFVACKYHRQRKISQ